ncbi:MAG TPA: ABC transporter ATP-binding protein [Vicinamibacterales bacterium]|nr:ABC transporter ATP-binding protein [Vicinamibacterales bacterium]
MAWWKRSQSTSPEAVRADLPLIRLEHVTKIFRTGDPAEPETRALDDVTVDIGHGEYVAVSGPSGCGKSTFLSLLGLLDSPSSGHYWLSGRRVDALTASERARVRSVEIGLVFQSFNLIGDMTVYENVEYPLTLKNVAGDARKARVEQALTRVGLAARAKQRPGQLSGGHQQLVAIARAMAGRPPIVLADEPTGNLDSRSGEIVMEMLAELHRDGATICLASHDPRYVSQARRHVYLLDGRVVTEPSNS